MVHDGNTWNLGTLKYIKDALDHVVTYGKTKLEEYEEKYNIVASLKKGATQYQSIRDAAKIELGLLQFLESGNYKGFTDTFEDLHGMVQLPGIAAQRLMAKGYGFAGEGDWKTSALGAILKSMTPAGGGTSFMEDYTYHFGPGNPKILGAHMLEVCPTITKTKPKIEIHPLGIGGKEDPVRMVFTADPAEARVACLVDMGDRFRIISNEIKVVKPDAALPKLPVAHAVWEPKPTLATSAEAWMLAGGSHHTVLTNAVSLEAIEDFARMARVEHVIIDEATNIREFRSELQWNAAYHRFAERIFDTVEIDFHLITNARCAFAARAGEFAKSHTTFGFQTEINHCHVFFDGDDFALDD